jgi:hypothetical protein
MDLEQEIHNKGANVAPRITPSHIEDCIASVHFFTAADGVNSAKRPDTVIGDDSLQSLELLTICVLVLKNGFTIVGKSACASPENYNADIGKDVAWRDAKEQIWPLEGYLLKQNLYEQKQSQDMLKGFLEDDSCEGGGCKI